MLSLIVGRLEVQVNSETIEVISDNGEMIEEDPVLKISSLEVI